MVSKKSVQMSSEDEHIRYLRERNPLAEPIRSATAQANLSRRGFRSVYYIESGFTGLQPNERVAKFGLLREDDEGVQFSIGGLPPPQGTKVWIAGTFSSRIADVYASQEAAIAAATIDSDHGLGILYDNMDLREANWPIAVQLLKQQGLYDGGHGLYFLVQVILP